MSSGFRKFGAPPPILFGNIAVAIIGCPRNSRWKAGNPSSMPTSAPANRSRARPIPAPPRASRLKHGPEIFRDHPLISMVGKAPGARSRRYSCRRALLFAALWHKSARLAGLPSKRAIRPRSLSGCRSTGPCPHHQLVGSLCAGRLPFPIMPRPTKAPDSINARLVLPRSRIGSGNRRRVKRPGFPCRKHTSCPG
jgi:hypothetical protein